MKVSIITACRNAVATIGDAAESVRRQILPAGVELEYLVVDGASTDGTADVVARFASEAKGRGLAVRWVSEPDRGLYDAINKGIRMSTGDIVGICNADDVLAADDIVARVARQFLADGSAGAPPDCVYGDVRFVAKGVASVDGLRAAKVTRYCTGRFFRRWMFRFATFPAHPGTFVRREVFDRAGWYSLDYPISADFEFMLRLFWKHRVRAQYLPLCTHVMRAGGVSTGGARSTVQINREDLRALKANGYWSCLPLVYLKYPFKVFGILLSGYHMKTSAY